MRTATIEVKQILTRTEGFLRTVSSHSLQPYRGCALGRSQCGLGCYVQHNIYLTRGERWGDFVDARINAADVYRGQYDRERDWARRQKPVVGAPNDEFAHRGRFAIFMSSSTEPFQPVEQKFRITQSILAAMVDHPPDLLIVQSHSHHVADYLALYLALASRAELRFHISIETDRDEIPGMPPPASSVAKRLTAARTLKDAGLRVFATVAPLLPIENPHRFFEQLAGTVDAVVIDHFIERDGSKNGARTRRTVLPVLVENLHPGSASLEYRQETIDLAQVYFPGRVGVSCNGFAGRMLQNKH